tara:strand:- start:722 stop:1513 length:792 start_codon:yes stop_codon:yes gene_type:complete
MNSERLQLSWGIDFLDTKYPKIETREVMLIRGKKSSNSHLIKYIICEELSKQKPVYWIDGGMGLDPSLLIPILLKKNGKVTDLDYLHACRGFTAHQMLEIIKRLASKTEEEDKLHRGKLIVISDLVNMFTDEQVSSSEGNAMLKMSLYYIKEIVQKYNSVAILTVGSKQESYLSQSMKDTLTTEIRNSISIISKSREITVLKSELTGMVTNPLLIRNYKSYSQDLEVSSQVSKVVCTDPVKMISSSEIPNGDKSADDARKAKA